MMAAGIIVFLVGIAGSLLTFTGIGGDYIDQLNKMPLGLWGWVIVAAVGLVLTLMGRRPAD